MGAAIGFTLAQSAPVALAVFALLGLGMALPVVLLAFAPRFLRMLPRPGAWMETFKQVLAFPLYATVAWLAWVLGNLGGVDAIFALLAGLVLVAMGAWFYGRWAHAGGLWQPAIAIMLGVVGLVVAWPGTNNAIAAEAVKTGEMGWQPWSPEEVRRLTDSGRPVFVDFTAAWCVTCQVNKRVALNSDATRAALARQGVVLMRADWTNRDARITAALAEFGRNGVPLYLLYDRSGVPTVLPEILTPGAVVEAVERLR
jgi:thiol:disulfide interchange protein DsbD